VDADNDGYPVNRDCNDQEATIHPGAPEVWRDGVDQDCNGFDFTIDVKYAVYSHDGGALNLRASSAYRENAALTVVGVGPLTWRAVRNDWIFTGGAGTPQPVLTIRGPEGEVTVHARQPTKRRNKPVRQ
jgi:hypothetical protein